MKKKVQKAFRKDAVGRTLSVQIPIVGLGASVADVERMLIRGAREFDTLSYIYIVDAHNRLEGVLSIRELFASPKTARVIDIASRKLITVRANTDRERAALIAIKHNIKSLPVVDKENVLLGVFSTDTILQTLHTEAVEDVLRFAGGGSFDDPVGALMKEDAGMHAWKRLPWLVVGLLGGVGAAFIVSFFENVFAGHLALVAFIPAVVYMADAVGAQTQMIFVRTIGLQGITNLSLYVWREVKINLFLGAVLGILIALISFIWLSDLRISSILGLSIFATVLISMVIAILIPWVLQILKQDPAIASGPPATVARDVTSLIVYFAIAGLLI